MSVVELCIAPVHALLEDAAEHPLPIATVVAALTAWAEENGTELKEVGQQSRRRGENITGLNDPMVDFLEAKGMVRGEGNNGEVQIWCPWQHEHSGDSGPSETVWFPAGTNGYERGGFKCLHAHCAGRRTSDFERAIGFDIEDFAVLTPLDGSTPDPIFNRRDHFGIAQSALTKLWQQNSKKLLLRTQGTWYEFNGTNYVERSEELVRRPLWEYLNTLKVIDHWTRYKDVYDVSMNQELFSSHENGIVVWDFEDEELERQRSNFMSMKPADHAAVKKVIMPPFTPRALAERQASLGLWRGTTYLRGRPTGQDAAARVAQAERHPPHL